MKKKTTPEIDTLYRFYARQKRMPSYSEAAELFGFASKFAAHKKIKNFIKQGLLEQDSKGKLLPKEKALASKKIVVLGSVEAGFGSPYEESVNGRVTLDDWMLANKANTYMLKVSGDSMKDAGILDGDMILVEKTSTAKLGEIIVADIDGSYTVKYLRKNKQGHYLEAANDAYPDLYPNGELRIIARVIGSVRKYV